MSTIRHLDHADTLELPVTGDGPFDFRHTLWKPSHYRTALEAHTADQSWRTFRLDDLVLGVTFSQHDDSTIVAKVHSDGEYTPEHGNRLRHRLITSYNLDMDLSPFHDLAASLPLMSAPMAALSGTRRSCPEDFFEISIIALLSHNTSVTKSEQMTRSLLANYGHLVHFNGITLRAWFTPDEIYGMPAETFRWADGLGYRDKYLVAIASFFAERPVHEIAAAPSRLDLLQQIKGMGPSAAAVLHSHASQNPADFPIDKSSREIYSTLLFDTNNEDDATIRARMSELFPGHASTAALYLREHQFLGAPVTPLLTSNRLKAWNEALAS